MDKIEGTKRRSAESDDHKEEREVRITEVMKRVQQHAERAGSKTDGDPSVDPNAVEGPEAQPRNTRTSNS